MMSNSDEIKRYLLGKLSEDDRERIEVLILSDYNLVDEITLIEEELIEDYILDAMSSENRKRFEKFFLTSPERVAQTELIKSLRTYIEASERGERFEYRDRAFSNGLKGFWQIFNGLRTLRYEVVKEI